MIYLSCVRLAIIIFVFLQHKESSILVEIYVQKLSVWPKTSRSHCKINWHSDGWPVDDIIKMYPSTKKSYIGIIRDIRVKHRYYTFYRMFVVYKSLHCCSRHYLSHNQKIERDPGGHKEFIQLTENEGLLWDWTALFANNLTKIMTRAKHHVLWSRNIHS